jgi:transcriptional regulator of acetoin/glycerol metabolism
VILNEDRRIHSADVLIGTSMPPRPTDQPLSMTEMEKHFIRQSLELNDGNVTDTAKALGLTRTALYRRMKRHGL